MSISFWKLYGDPLLCSKFVAGISCTVFCRFNGLSHLSCAGILEWTPADITDTPCLILGVHVRHMYSFLVEH
ncbi:hypothetical protein Pfo_024110, partial [Paulownia fortunei]